MYNFLLITIYVDVHYVTLSRFVFLSQLFKGCAAVPFPFFNARRDSLGLSTVINTRYVFFTSPYIQCAIYRANVKPRDL